MDKADMVYLYNRILLSDKKEWNLAICNNLDGHKSIMESELSQTEKDKYCMISFIREIKKKNKWSNTTKQKLRLATENRLFPEEKAEGKGEK